MSNRDVLNESTVREMNQICYTLYTHCRDIARSKEER